MVQYKRASSSELEQLGRLWQEAFNEPKQDADFVLYELCRLQDIFIATENTKAIAMLTTIPVCYKGKKGSYIYGVNTAKEWRGKGIMAQLLQYTQLEKLKEQEHFTVLVPTNEGLFDYYAKQNYSSVCPTLKTEITTSPKACFAVSFGLENAQKLEQLRREHLSERLVYFTSRTNDAFYNYLLSNGARFVTAQKGYGIYFKIENEIVFRELICQDKATKTDIICAVSAREKVKKVSVVEFCKQAQDSSYYAMLHYLQGEFDCEDMILNMMFD